MADMENVPPIQDISTDQMDRIKAELGLMEAEAEINSAEVITDGQTGESEPIPIKRRRGRPRKYLRDQFNRPIKDKPIEGSEEEPTVPLPAAPLTTRDAKEVAIRFKGILIGATQLGAVLDPAILMTDQEAENISKPLASYMLRTEATSKMAQRVLNEYDVVAFVLAIAAYMVRVVKDMRSEREQSTEGNTEPKPRRTLQRVPTSQRVIEPETEQIAPETTGANENGQEGATGIQWPIPATKHGDVTEV